MKYIDVVVILKLACFWGYLESFLLKCVLVGSQIYHAFPINCANDQWSWFLCFFCLFVCWHGYKLIFQQMPGFLTVVSANKTGPCRIKRLTPDVFTHLTFDHFPSLIYGSIKRCQMNRFVCKLGPKKQQHDTSIFPTVPWLDSKGDE